MNSREKIHDVAIIGAGPAGISCAIQLKRYGIEPLIFEKDRIGGLLRNANFVENYPGFAFGLPGQELVDKLRAHLESLKVSPVCNEVVSVDFTGEVFSIKTGSARYESKVLAVSSGTKPGFADIEIPGPAASYVFYEIYDLYKQEVKDKKIVIIGAGDAAFDYALNLAANSRVREVVILNRGTETKCLELLKQRAFDSKKIIYIENEELTKIEASGENLVLTSGVGNVFKADYLLFAIGREANTGFLSGELLKNREELKSRKKLFFIGDVKNDIFRQTAIAAGDGVHAAMEIHKTLYDRL